MDEKKIYFTVETSDVINDILRKYGLKETPEELHIKLSNRKMPNGGLILDIVVDSFINKSSNKIQEILKEKLNINQEIAIKISEDIKNKLLAFTTDKLPISTTNNNIKKNENELLNDINIVEKIKPPIGIQNILNPKVDDNLNGNKKNTDYKEPFKKQIDTDADLEIEKNKKQKKSSKKSDSYREPIE